MLSQLAALLALVTGVTGCGDSTSMQAKLRPAVPFGQRISKPQGIACIDASHAAVATNRDGLHIVKLEVGVSATGVAMLPADQRVDEAHFLVAPNRLYFFNDTYGMLHVIDTTNPDAPVEIAATDKVPLGQVAGPDRVVFTSHTAGIVALDMTDPRSPLRGAPGKMFLREQKFTPAAGTPMVLIGDVLLAMGSELNEIYSFDVKDPMTPVEIGRLSLLDPARPASRKVTANGWAVRGNLLYIGAAQLPDPPDFTAPATAISNFVVDVVNPRAPSVVTYPRLSLVGPRIIRNDPTYGVVGIASTAAGTSVY